MSSEVMDKDKWVLLFKEIGLDEETMVQWHRAFETRFPEGHQSFLEWLNIEADEIRHIRNM
jgi:hypothetical protein